jgi:hypothetical protein
MNTGLKPTDFIHPTEALILLTATYHAFLMGCELNMIIHLNLDRAHILTRPQNFVIAFLNKYAEYMRRHCDIPPYYIYVIENPDGKLNIHIQLHVPPHLYKHLSAKTKVWLVQLGGIGPHNSIECAFIEKYTHLRNTTKYLLKGSTPEFCDQHGIQHISQNHIIGKRYGLSETLAPKLNHDWIPDCFLHSLLQPY